MRRQLAKPCRAWWSRRCNATRNTWNAHDTVAREAVRLIACDPELDRRFRLMLTTTGIAETSALQILGELAMLPDMLDARQWVAFSGLDPRLFKSGKSVEKRPR